MQSNFDLNNMTTYRGDDMGILLQFRDTAGAVIDITGWTFFFTLKHTKDDPDDEAIYTQDNSNPPDPTLGNYHMVISNTATQNLAGQYWYDIQIKKMDGTIQTITNGYITFERDATRRTV